MEDKNKATKLSDQDLEQAAGGQWQRDFLSARGKDSLQAATFSRSGTFFSLSGDNQDKEKVAETLEGIRHSNQ